MASDPARETFGAPFEAGPAVVVAGPPADGNIIPTRVRHLVLASACLLAIITYLLRVGFSAVSTDIRNDLGLTQSHLGYLNAAFMIAYGIFEVPWGALGDRFGVRGPLVWVALGGSLSTAAVALVGFLPSGAALALGALILMRALFGAFQAGTFPLVSRMIADWVPTTERGSAQGYIWMSSRLGGSLAPLVLKPLLLRMGSWQAPLLTVATAGFAWAISFWPWFRNRPEQSRLVNEAEVQLIRRGGLAEPPAHHRAPWGKMLRSRSVWALCLMYGGLGYSGNFFLFFLNDYLVTQRGLGPNQVKWLSALPFVFGIAACLIGGKCSDSLIRRAGGDRRWGRRVVGMFGLTLAAFSILATLWADHVLVLGAFLCLTFFANDLSMAPAWAAAADIGERHAGALGGFMNMTASFTGALGMILIGLLLDAGWERLPFWLFFLSYLAGALAWLAVDTTRPLTDAGPPSTS